MIKDNIFNISQKIISVCNKLGRDPNEVTLVGISKYADASQIAEAIDAGLTHIGENRMQDAQHKFSSLEAYPLIVKHMVGHLQSNKVKQAIDLFDLIESVDSVKLIDEIQKQAEKINKQVSVLIQVNVSGEEQKFGLDPEEVNKFFQDIVHRKNVKVQGLMTIAPLTDDVQVIRRCFAGLKSMFDDLSGQYEGENNISMKYLSMGMTNDYEIALEEGSNMVRIGRAIFHGE